MVGLEWVVGSCSLAAYPASLCGFADYFCLLAIFVVVVFAFSSSLIYPRLDPRLAGFASGSVCCESVTPEARSRDGGHCSAVGISGAWSMRRSLSENFGEIFVLRFSNIASM